MTPSSAACQTAESWRRVRVEVSRLSVIRGAGRVRGGILGGRDTAAEGPATARPEMPESPNSLGVCQAFPLIVPSECVIVTSPSSEASVLLAPQPGDCKVSRKSSPESSGLEARGNQNRGCSANHNCCSEVIASNSVGVYLEPLAGAAGATRLVRPPRLTLTPLNTGDLGMAILNDLTKSWNNQTKIYVRQ